MAQNIEFKLHKTFTETSLNNKQTVYSKDSELLVISSYVLPEHEKTLYAGLSNGKILQFKTQRVDRSILGKEHLTSYFPSKKNHKGEIFCMLYENVVGVELLMTGSADRAIKLWDPKVAKGDTNIQTIIGSGGSVLDLKYVRKMQQLVSASTDRTLRIWRIDSGREFLLYPWFVALSIIKTVSANPEKSFDSHLWVNCVDVKQAENISEISILAGDSEGNLLQFKGSEAYKGECRFYNAKRHPAKHRIGVLQVLVAQHENYVFTCGFDGYIKGFDVQDGKEFFCMRNPNKTYYTALAWDRHLQELFVADMKGYMGVINIYVEKPLLWRQMTTQRIFHIQLIYKDKRDLQGILVGTPTELQVFRIERGKKSQEIVGHTDSIISLVCMEPRSLGKSNAKDEPKILSASMDNSIKLWDARERNLLSTMEGREKSEISSMGYLKKSSLVATGHEDGVIRLWSLELHGVSEQQELKTDNRFSHNNVISALTTHSYKDQDKEILLCADYDSKISVWEMSDKPEIHTNRVTAIPRAMITNSLNPYERPEHGSEVLALAFNPINNTIIAAGNNRNINIWKFGTWEYDDTLRGHQDSVTCMTLDENYLFSGSDDTTIKVWETHNKYLIYNLKGHTASVQDLLIIEQTGLLLSCGYDHKILVWNYEEENEKIIKTFEKEEEELRCMSYLKCQSMLLVGNNEHNIYTYDITDLLDGSILNKPKTEREREQPASGEEEELKHEGSTQQSRSQQGGSPDLSVSMQSNKGAFGEDLSRDGDVIHYEESKELTARGRVGVRRELGNDEDTKSVGESEVGTEILDEQELKDDDVFLKLFTAAGGKSIADDDDDDYDEEDITQYDPEESHI